METWRKIISHLRYEDLLRRQARIYTSDSCSCDYGSYWYGVNLKVMLGLIDSSVWYMTQINANEYSIGLFQINTQAHGDMGPERRKAFGLH